MNLAMKVPWREALSGIPRWLEQEVRLEGVKVHLDATADEKEVLSHSPDIVIIATGGSPSRPDVEGGELALTSWDITSRRVAVADSVLIYDELGGQSGLSCAEIAAAAGAQVELVTPDRMTAADVGATNFATHMRTLARLSVILSPNLVLEEIRRDGDVLAPVLRNSFSLEREERRVSQVVYEAGTVPNDELYWKLKPLSQNKGQTDYQDLLAGRSQVKEGGNGLYLFRIGDAVSSRNVHAALFDALRVCKDL